MKKWQIIGFIALLNIGNTQATTFNFDGILDLYTGTILTDSTTVTGVFSFIAEPFNSDFSGMFTGELFSLPVTANLTIPTGVENPVFSPLSLNWNGNDFIGDLLIGISFTSLDVFQITTLDGDNDGIPGSVFGTGPNQSTSLAISGEFSAVPLPAALWLFSSGIVLGIITIRRRIGA